MFGCIPKDPQSAYARCECSKSHFKEMSLGPMDGRIRAVPRFSEDIAAAWQVVEKLGVVLLERHAQWRCTFRVGFADGEPIFAGISRLEDFRAEASTAPLAICLAALSAVGWKPGDVEDPPR